MIKTKKQGLLIVLSGPSGSGKNTVCDEVKKNNSNIWESISMTSRKPRKGEEDGKAYYFVSENEFEKNIEDDKMLEWAKFAGNYYGTPKESVQKHFPAVACVFLCRTKRPAGNQHRHQGADNAELDGRVNQIESESQ